MKRRFLCAALAACMAFSITGCGSSKSELPEVPDAPVEYYPDDIMEELENGAEPEATPEPVAGIEGPAVDTDSSDGPTGEGAAVPAAEASEGGFEDDLGGFLETDAGYAGRSYLVSPLSLRAALCLAVYGADGETRSQLLGAAGFEDDPDMKAWYRSVTDARDGFLADYEALKSESELYGDGADPGMAFLLANGAWDNASKEGGFLEDYVSGIGQDFGATASSSPADTITADVNAWCSENTNGLIPKISDDLSYCSAVLANALYVKSAWRERFYESATEAGTFALADGSEKEMDFMCQTNDFLYREDAKGRQYACFALEGDVWLTVCLDDGAAYSDLEAAAQEAFGTKLDVKMPKLDLESAFDKKELVQFLGYRGVQLAFSDGADFSRMTDAPEGWHVDDVVQKARLKTDEQGLEAAAVTMIAMVDNAVIEEPVEPVAFYMDRPFAFCITYGRGTGALPLFIGQYTGVDE